VQLRPIEIPLITASYPTEYVPDQDRPTRQPLIRNDGVAGSSPACGTTIPVNFAYLSRLRSVPGQLQKSPTTFVMSAKRLITEVAGQWCHFQFVPTPDVNIENLTKLGWLLFDKRLGSAFCAATDFRIGLLPIRGRVGPARWAASRLFAWPGRSLAGRYRRPSRQ